VFRQIIVTSSHIYAALWRAGAAGGENLRVAVYLWFKLRQTLIKALRRVFATSNLISFDFMGQLRPDQY